MICLHCYFSLGNNSLWQSIWRPVIMYIIKKIVILLCSWLRQLWQILASSTEAIPECQACPASICLLFLSPCHLLLRTPQHYYLPLIVYTVHLTFVLLLVQSKPVSASRGDSHTGSTFWHAVSTSVQAPWLLPSCWLKIVTPNSLVPRPSPATTKQGYVWPEGKAIPNPILWLELRLEWMKLKSEAFIARYDSVSEMKVITDCGGVSKDLFHFAVVWVCRA